MPGTLLEARLYIWTHWKRIMEKLKLVNGSVFLVLGCFSGLTRSISPNSVRLIPPVQLVL